MTIYKAEAQLRALEQLAPRGAVVALMWNKSHREQAAIGLQLTAVLAVAQRARAGSCWKGTPTWT